MARLGGAVSKLDEGDDGWGATGTTWVGDQIIAGGDSGWNAHALAFVVGTLLGVGVGGVASKGACCSPLSVHCRERRPAPERQLLPAALRCALRVGSRALHAVLPLQSPPPRWLPVLSITFHCMTFNIHGVSTTHGT